MKYEVSVSAVTTTTTTTRESGMVLTKKSLSLKRENVLVNLEMLHLLMWFSFMLLTHGTCLPIVQFYRWNWLNISKGLRLTGGISKWLNLQANPFHKQKTNTVKKTIHTQYFSLNLSGLTVWDPKQLSFREGISIDQYPEWMT